MPQSQISGVIKFWGPRGPRVPTIMIWGPHHVFADPDGHQITHHVHACHMRLHSCARNSTAQLHTVRESL